MIAKNIRPKGQSKSRRRTITLCREGSAIVDYLAENEFRSRPKVILRLLKAEFSKQEAQGVETESHERHV